ncbi:MAG: hypothetical protein ACOC3C_04755 [Candidatus Thorarchaeota archaeon]
MNTWDKFFDELKALKNLKRNWDSYDAEPTSIVVINKILKIMPKIVTVLPETPPPSVHPIPDGGVSVEWHLPSSEVEIEFSPVGGIYAIVDDTEEYDITDDYSKLKEIIHNVGTIAASEQMQARRQNEKL